MEDLVFVTGNHDQYVSINEQFKNKDISIEYFDCDLEILDNDNVIFISKEKSRRAYEILNKPVFVVDSGFYIEYYLNDTGYSGTFSKRVGVGLDIDKSLEKIKDAKDIKLHFLDCLTFYDGDNYYQFFDIGKVIQDYQKGYINAIEEFVDWYQNSYLKSKRLMKYIPV